MLYSYFASFLELVRRVRALTIQLLPIQVDITALKEPRSKIITNNGSLSRFWFVNMTVLMLDLQSLMVTQLLLEIS